MFFEWDGRVWIILYRFVQTHVTFTLKTHPRGTKQNNNGYTIYIQSGLKRDIPINKSNRQNIIIVHCVYMMEQNTNILIKGF